VFDVVVLTALLVTLTTLGYDRPLVLFP
jgi:hypothetical protein